MWKISLSSGSIYEHKDFYGGRKKVHQIDDEARLSRGTIVKIKIEASLASLSCNSFRATTARSAIFAFGVYVGQNLCR